ncbi:MAG: site-specific integrase [Candidatus Sericytochromatia bacterium]|nr:site-specific integrase [Candidatus Tanganyikabacteria bacterium]
MAGTITKRGERTYLVRVDMDRDPVTGKRKRIAKTIHGTKKDAEAWLHKQLTARDTGTYLEPSEETLAGYLKRWLAEAKEASIAPATARMYREFITGYLAGDVGSVPIGKLSALDLQGLYRDLAGDGIGPARIRRLHGMLGSALKQAVRWSLISRNPAAGVELPKLQEAEMCALTEDQAGRFLEAAACDRHYVLWAFLLETGARPGEALALRWKDVDSKARTVTLRRSMTWLDEGRFTFHDTKTRKSVRTIPISDNLAADLKRHRAEQAAARLAAGQAWQDHDLVFAGETGRPLRRSSLSRQHLKPILKAAGLPWSSASTTRGIPARRCSWRAASTSRWLPSAWGIPA